MRVQVKRQPLPPSAILSSASQPLTPRQENYLVDEDDDEGLTDLDRFSIIRNMGIHIPGEIGAGKSRMMGRLIAYTDFLTGHPLLMIDPRGSMIDNFLDRLMYLPKEEQLAIRDRLLYVDMSGTSGYVAQFPLLYRLPGNTLYDVAMRFLEVCRRLDPEMERAPSTGWAPFKMIGSNIGMVLHALGKTIADAPSLLDKPPSGNLS